MRPRNPLALAAVVLLCACAGEGGGGPGPTGPPPPPTPLRRLSHVEYANTARDLFPGVALPPLDLAPDPEIEGFENNSSAQSPSPLLVEQYRTAALLISAAAMARRNLVVPCQPASSEEEIACGRQFVDSFGARAFRRPLEPDEQTRFSDFFEEQRLAGNFGVAVQLTIQAMLQSPQFLYRPELAAPLAGETAVPLAPYELASRLSYFLWGSMPDEALFAAAASGAITTRDELEAQARRLLADPRARGAVADFHRQWLDLDRLAQTNKDPAAHPEWDEGLRTAMREEQTRFVEHVVFDGPGTLGALLTERTTFVDAELAAIYGVAAPPAGEWRQIELDGNRRAGLLTQAGFLASRAHAVHPSPVQRGVFVLRRLLCDDLPPPGPEVDTTPPQADPDGAPKTNRQRYVEHEAPGCETCHRRIDGIGFAMEHFDSIGRWRDEDNGLPVDATGELVGTDVDGSFDGAVDLAEKLAGSAQVRRCYVTQWFRYASGRIEADGDEPALAALDEVFAGAGQDVRELLVAIAVSAAFTHRFLAAED